VSVVVFTNQKGGPGKSTLSVLYAQWLADRQQQRVAFIDLDSQCNASKSLRTSAGLHSADELFKERDFAVAAAERGAIRLFAGSRALVDLERSRPDVVIPAFRRHMARVSAGFDACVIDTPPALGLRMSAALMAAQHVACPIELEEYSIDGVTDMLKTIFGVRHKYNPALRLAGIIANRFNPHSLRQREALASLLANYREFVVPAKISTRSAIPESLASGVPLWRMTKTSAREASAEVERVFGLLDERMAAVLQEVA
jgi:chromosome partitioning protein